MTSLNYINETDRLKTFENWPLEYIDKHLLAKIGFYYLGNGDRVKCFVCSYEIYNWEENDDPIADHKRYSPYCRLMRGLTTLNIPIDLESFKNIIPEVSEDTVGNNIYSNNRPYFLFNNINTRHSSVELNENEELIEYPLLNLNRAVSYNNFEELNRIIETQEPCFSHLDYAIEENRLKSFKDWPKAIKQRPKELADAGFFYIGYGNHVTCFKCNIMIKNWEIDDDVWLKHYNWSPSCPYVLLMKGENLPSIDKKHSLQPKKEIDELTLSSSSSLINLKTDTYICKICYQKESNTIFLPCGHSTACKKCAMVIQTQFGKCSICKVIIDKIQPIFFT